MKEKKKRQPCFVTALDLDFLNHAHAHVQKIKKKSPMSW